MYSVPSFTFVSLYFIKEIKGGKKHRINVSLPYQHSPATINNNLPMFLRKEKKAQVRVPRNSYSTQEMSNWELDPWYVFE